MPAVKAAGLPLPVRRSMRTRRWPVRFGLQASATGASIRSAACLRLQPCRTLWIGKGTYIAEFQFCEANCVPYFERILPTIEWKVDARAV